jgi:hypothetical protein
MTDTEADAAPLTPEEQATLADLLYRDFASALPAADALAGVLTPEARGPATPGPGGTLRYGQPAPPPARHAADLEEPLHRAPPEAAGPLSLAQAAMLGLEPLDIS